GYGVSKSRYAEEKRVVLEKNLGPLIATDMTRCIHCTRCVRFGREIGGIMELGMTGRGEHAEIMPFIESTVDSELSGNMIDVCPVGALTSKPFRFTARPWELSSASGLSPHDSWGAHLSLQTKDGKIKRVVPREKDDINECWISDRDRFSYQGLSAGDRAASPLLRPPDARQFADAGWREAVAVVVRELQKRAPDKTGFFAAPTATCEELFLWQKLARGLGCENIDSRLRLRDFSADAPSQFGFNISELARADAILFVGADPAREQPLLAPRLRGRRRRLFSIGALDIGGQIPLAARQPARPSEIAARLLQLNRLLNLAERRPESLFDDAAPPAEIQKMAERFGKKGGAKHIILGDAVCGAEDFGDILREARTLSEGTGASLGVLSAGANGAGARRFGAFPREGGMSAGAMLRADLDAVMLFNCEPRDFAESARAEQMLASAGFVGALSPFVGGVRSFAHIVLPTAIFGENEGALMNGEGKMQRFSSVARPPGEARPGWKVLRILGDALGIDGFHFNTLDEVREMMEETPPLAPSLSEKVASPPPSGEMLEIIGGAAIYDGDMLVRRAAALQKTARGGDIFRVLFHPDDMAQRGISEGGDVRLGDGESFWDARAFADDKIVRGAISAYPSALRSLRVYAEPVAEQRRAAG
ncbi:MAG: molybdopterin-dependent oxidoreductase, partial [Gammaproteobacteria bacterium]